MRSVLPIHFLDVDQTKVRLVHERRGLEAVARTLAGHMSAARFDGAPAPRAESDASAPRRRHRATPAAGRNIGKRHGNARILSHFRASGLCERVRIESSQACGTAHSCSGCLTDEVRGVVDAPDSLVGLRQRLRQTGRVRSGLPSVKCVAMIGRVLPRLGPVVESFDQVHRIRAFAAAAVVHAGTRNRRIQSSFLAPPIALRMLE
jgi:hypothetical protein